MKFAIFALVAGLCLVAAKASDPDIVGQNAGDDVDDYEYIAEDLAKELLEIEPRSIFSGTYFITKRALKTLKGLNCTIKEVIAIQIAAQTFIDDIYACEGAVTKKMQNLVNACNDILTTCKEILGINESICGNTTTENETMYGVIANAKTTHKCCKKMLRKVQTLNKQIKNAKKLIKQIKKVPGDFTMCNLDAVNTLEAYFTQFPENIKVCSKLTSK